MFVWEFSIFIWAKWKTCEITSFFRENCSFYFFQIQSSPDITNFLISKFSIQLFFLSERSLFHIILLKIISKQRYIYRHMRNFLKIFLHLFRKNIKTKWIKFDITDSFFIFQRWALFLSPILHSLWPVKFNSFDVIKRGFQMEKSVLIQFRIPCQSMGIFTRVEQFWNQHNKKLHIFSKTNEIFLMRFLLFFQINFCFVFWIRLDDYKMT